MLVQRYRKKPVIVDAIRFTDGPDNCFAISEFVGAAVLFGSDEVDGTRYARIHSPWGMPYSRLVIIGDWIIKSTDGKFDVCRNKEFEETYDWIGSFEVTTIAAEKSDADSR